MAQQKNEIILVSGLPRSGTSLMMQILESGGLEILTDSIRQADESNPKGYYEFERVKKMREGDREWLSAANGKVIKVISFLLKELPTDYQYKIIFMQRKMDEILRSQRKMLESRGQSTTPEEEKELSVVFNKHLVQIKNWLAEQPNMKVLYLSYNDLIADPSSHLERVRAFLGDDLAIEPMLSVVDKSLYRQRS